LARPAGARDHRVVGITLDKQRATERFGQALVLARSEEQLPKAWLTYAREIGRARNRTFTPLLGTALLARAADDTVDVASLREDESPRGYSARSLAKDILIPCCARAGIDLRNKGKEPLNNQPFLKAARVSPDMTVRKSSVGALKYLCECLAQLEKLRGRAALEALAAFLRVRIQDSKQPAPVELGSGVLDLPDLLNAIDQVAEEDETGGVATASVAAAFSLMFRDVRTRHANDPTASLIGNIGVLAGGAQTMALEVSSRQLAEADVLLLAQRMAAAGIGRGFVLSTALIDSDLDRSQLEFQARRLHSVELALFDRVSTLVRLVVLLAQAEVAMSLASLPRLILNWMGKLNVPSERMHAWSTFFSDSPGTPRP
jgi:hypothetical protein